MVLKKSSKAVSLALVLSLLLSLTSLSAFAASYKAQGVLPAGASETNEIYMVTADSTITTESESPYYYNVIGTKFNYSENIGFTFEFGGASGTNNVSADVFKGKIAIYSDSALKNLVASYADGGVLTMGAPTRGKSHLTYSRGVTATLTVPANTLSADSEYFLVFDGTIGYREITIGKDIVFKFKTLGDPNKVSGVKLDQSGLLFDGLGLSYDLAKTVEPTSALDKTVSFSSSNTGVATVNSDGKITSVAEGRATITVTTGDGGFTDTCEVIVTDKGTEEVYRLLDASTAERFGSNDAAFKFVAPAPIYRGINNPNQLIFLNEYKYTELPDFKITCVPSGGQKSTKVYLSLYTASDYISNADEIDSMTHIGYDGSSTQAIQDVVWKLSEIESEKLTDAEQYCIVIGSETYSGSNRLDVDVVINAWTVCEHSKAVSVKGTAATCVNTGLTDGMYCEYCDFWIVEQNVLPALGHNYVDGVCSRCGAVNYVITDGNKASYVMNSDRTLSFTANGSIEKFVSVKVDGKTVDKSNYTVKSGSTIITFTAEYLDTLSAGKHTIDVVYTDGVASGYFTVGDATIANTADITIVGSAMALLVASACGVAAVEYKKRED